MIEVLLALVPLAAVQDPLGTWMSAPLADGSRAAVPCADGTIRLFELATGRTDEVLQGHEGAVLAVVPAPDGATLATCGEDSTIRMWDLADGACRSVMATEREIHPYWGHTLAFSPAGDRLLAVGYEGWARVWDVASAKALLTPPAELQISAAAWTPDGRLGWRGSLHHDRQLVLYRRTEYADGTYTIQR